MCAQDRVKTWAALNRGNETSGFLKGEEFVDGYLVKQVTISLS